jgi:hypothetical protein
MPDLSVSNSPVELEPARSPVSRDAPLVRWYRSLRLGAAQIIIILVAVFGIGISLLDWLGQLDQPWVVHKVPNMTLLLLAGIALYLIEERRQEHAELRRAVGRRDEKLADALRAAITRNSQEQSSLFLNALEVKGGELVTAVKGVFVKKLDDPDEYYRYLADRVRTAKRRIDDLTWGAVSLSDRAPAEVESYDAYVAAIIDACTHRKDLKVREVYTFPNMLRIERVEDMLGRNLPNYFVHYFDVNHDGLPPLLQFTVIDGEEVIFGTGRGQRRTSSGEKYLSIRSRPVAEKFAEYFNTIWESGKPIRDPNTNDLATLTRFKKKLERRTKPRP